MRGRYVYGRLTRGKLVYIVPGNYLYSTAKYAGSIYLGGISPTLISVKSMPLWMFSATLQTHMIETNQLGK